MAPLTMEVALVLIPIPSLRTSCWATETGVVVGVRAESRDLETIRGLRGRTATDITELTTDTSKILGDTRTWSRRILTVIFTTEHDQYSVRRAWLVGGTDWGRDPSGANGANARSRVGGRDEFGTSNGSATDIIGHGMM